ncbi:MAG: DUF2125 domain-containing protein [Proteobacteria bacterium]|nr:DUF2125 domain-containing protein [Pseudomonadota bacterium]MDA1131911.1 DUF2125 domain-containing protein [Pseudomonadota bacterium]
MRGAAILLAGVLAAAVLGAGGYTALWFSGASEAKARITAWADGVRTAGYDVEIGDIAVSGFPGPAELKITGLDIGLPSAKLPWVWRADTVLVAATDNRLELRLAAEHVLTVSVGGQDRTYRMAARRFQVDVGADGDGNPLLQFDIRGMFVDRGASGRLTVDRAEVFVNVAPGPGLLPDDSRILLSLANLVLPEHRRGPLGDTISVLRTELRLDGDIDNLDLATALPDWRNRDGRLVLGESRVSWGTLEMDTRGGSLALDDDLKPTGGFSGIITGYEITIDAFQAAGRFTAEDMANIRAMMSFIRQQGRMGGGIGLPVSIREGRVRVGDAVLGTVPRLLPTD